jgi:hypothetical protein
MVKSISQDFRAGGRTLPTPRAPMASGQVAPPIDYASRRAEIQAMANAAYSAVFYEGPAGKVKKDILVPGGKGRDLVFRFALPPDSVYAPALQKDPPAIRVEPCGDEFSLSCERELNYEFVGRLARPASGRIIAAAAAVPALNYGRQMAVRLEQRLTSTPIDVQELIFLADGRYVTSLKALTLFGSDYFLHGERFLAEKQASEWPTNLVIDYYDLMHKAISLLNGKKWSENEWSWFYSLEQRDALAVAAASVLVEMEAQPAAADAYLKEILLVKGSALKLALTIDQMAGVVKRLRP